MHYGRVFFVDFKVVARNDALKDKTGGACLDHAARRPAKAIFLVILDPVHLVRVVTTSAKNRFHHV